MSEFTFRFIRHAESDWNKNKVHLVGGRSNHTPLTELGVEQAKNVGRYISENLPLPDVVIASPAVRTMDTARIALRSVGIYRHIRVDPRIQELSQGVAEGQPRDVFYGSAALRRIELEGIDFKHSGGESIRDGGVRMHEFIDDMYQTFNDKTSYAYVFGHGLSIKSLVGKLEMWDKDQILKAETPNTSITTIAGHPGNWRVSTVGFVPQPDMHVTL